MFMSFPNNFLVFLWQCHMELEILEARPKFWALYQQWVLFGIINNIIFHVDLIKLEIVGLGEYKLHFFRDGGG